MSQGCPSLQVEAVKRGLVLSSLDTANGSVIQITCAYADRGLVGEAQLQCLNGGKWSTELPTCSEDDDLSDREIMIISIGAAAVGILLLILVVVVVWMYCAKERRKIKLSERLQSRLDNLSLGNPLDELVRRESQRGHGNPSFSASVTKSELEGGVTRHLFKIWDHTRTIKQFAFAESLAELFEKATQRLNLNEPLRAVVEEDGSEITSDDVLVACSGAVLLILETGQSWTPGQAGDRARGDKADGVEHNGGVANGDVGHGGYDYYDGEML